MTLKLGKLLTSSEFTKIGDDNVARGLYRDDVTVLVPGTGWEMSWYYDPTKADQEEYASRRERGLAGKSFLSQIYWRDWSHLRPPINVVCPNGEHWCVDQPASNGPGWTVTGTWPLITASPSIVVPGYHGFLVNGEFSDDLERRGPVGTPRPYVPRTAG